ncbi:hypothetical protein BKA82DRAFT_995230 [Pisolithus tinctorius]|uniref:CID domain-containing protein n=1 Tax=Pisolithus tinctorius Marx 270 TaxID=870435 RepID=A0A0C3PPC1_PISTI|nr:hypothetical protein BKA82DRAFT_995230 [Pisolithus tinctorius]KIO10766.1 hypothetical protein M404DRAFT_995230 [Pisolithus tinctorius Marx 270]
MSALDEFENTLKDVVNAKRLSASKMTKLTEIALKTLKDDAKLVAILYRTHKSLPDSAKVSSLYAFDALARAARSSVTKHGLTADPNAGKGNAATFLLKMEGVLEGLFRDMIAINNAEVKEKTKKVLDIWIKSNTFPSTILTRLRDMLTDVSKESAVNSTSPAPQIAVEALGQSTTPASSLSTPATLNSNVQATLLSLLGQAAQVTAQSPANSQTSQNDSPPQLGQAQLALLQQLALTAKLGGVAQSQPAVPVVGTPRLNGHGSIPPNMASDTFHSPSRPPLGSHPRPGSNHGDPRHGGSGYSERLKDRNEYFDDRHSHRGSYRGGYRGRRDRWEDRSRDPFKQRDRDRDPSSRPRNSRSRSPRRSEWRDGGRQHSPPRRHVSGKDQYHTEPPSSAAPEGGKDEFGRDLRPSSASPPRSVSVDDAPTRDPMVPSVDPASAAAPDCRIPVSDQLPSVAANTPAQSTETHASSSAASKEEQQGLDQFDITTFDVTAASSWEALGNMWKTTCGYLPSQEELMQFVLASGMGMASTAANSHHDDSQGGQWGAGWAGQGTRGSGGWRARGRGYMNGGRGGYTGHGNYRDAGQHSNASQSQYSDAVVLGDNVSTMEFEVDQHSIPGEQSDVHDNESKSGDTEARGAGRMQRVGDKWVFVREAGP